MFTKNRVCLRVCQAAPSQQRCVRVCLYVCLCVLVNNAIKPWLRAVGMASPGINKGRHTTPACLNWNWKGENTSVWEENNTCRAWEAYISIVNWENVKCLLVLKKSCPGLAGQNIKIAAANLQSCFKKDKTIEKPLRKQGSVLRQAPDFHFGNQSI